MRRLTLLLVVALATLSTAGSGSADETWTIGNDQIQAVFRLTTFGLSLDLADPQTGRTLGATGEADTITIDGRAAPIGSSAGAWVLQDAAITDSGTRIDFTFRSQRSPVVLVRSYACYRGSPVLETWTNIRATSGSATIADPSVWQLTAATNTVHYEFGLRGDAAGLDVDDAFALQDASLGAGADLTLQEQNRSTEHNLPMISADMDSDEFFAGIMWSGSWQIQVQGTGDQSARATASLPHVTLTIDPAHPLETPHGFFGVTRGDRSAVSGALRGFLVNGVRGGRPFQPLVTYNTWFAYGTDIDEQSMMDEMTAAANVGVELFVVDAGWYVGAGRSGSGDFTSGLGTWQVDPGRFPDGLGALRDYAHSLGMLFGIWVEPERVDMTTVGRPQLAQQSWLASNNGNFGSKTAGQICLASPAARQWVIDRLTNFLDEVQPDYLKWDNNMWVNCNRGGHGHGTTDGNFAHVKGLYHVLQTLRDRYPDMLIENCSQGGNRADFGMLRYTDTAWMDDRTTPAVHVRHNLEGLMTFFPPAYLLSFVLNDQEPIAGSPDLPLFLRSRMPGILGLTYRSQDLIESDLMSLSAEINVYKGLRDTLVDASGSLLTDQANPQQPPPWDAVQEVSPDTGTVVVFAFQNDGAVPSTVLPLHGLKDTMLYIISTIDGESLGSATGAQLMSDGLEVNESFESAARVLVLRPAGTISRSVDGTERHE